MSRSRDRAKAHKRRQWVNEYLARVALRDPKTQDAIRDLATDTEETA